MGLADDRHDPQRQSWQLWRRVETPRWSRPRGTGPTTTSSAPAPPASARAGRTASLSLSGMCCCQRRGVRTMDVASSALFQAASDAARWADADSRSRASAPRPTASPRHEAVAARGASTEQPFHVLCPRARERPRGQQKRREGSSQRMTRGYETLANDNAKRARARALPENVETRRWTAPTATGLPAPRHRCDVAFSFWVCSSASYCPAASCAISGRRRRHRVRRCVAYATAAT